MKMTMSSVAILLFLVLGTSACKKDDTSTAPQFTIEDEINAVRPINLVWVSGLASGSNWTFQRSGTANNPLTDAYAERGYFIVKSSSTTHYFNLSTAKNVFTGANEVNIQY